MKKIIPFPRLLALLIIALTLLFTPGSLPRLPSTPYEQARVFTRSIEFDYVAWGARASLDKLRQIALGASHYLSEDQQKQVVMEYIDLVSQSVLLEAQIEQIYSEPSITDPQNFSIPWRDQLSQVQSRLKKTAPLAESILQQQISLTLRDLDLSALGQPIPPVLFQVTELPKALIISPRSVIRQDAFVSLEANLLLDQITGLEEQIARQMDVSALVEDVGGIGMYPTMIIRTTNLSFLIEVAAHEWIHNFLTLRPLGWNYDTSPELRSMNETTANLSGKEISQAVLRRFYPELLPKPQPASSGTLSAAPIESPPPEPVFDFRAEMHTTRLKADELLAAGKIEEAEAYMEERRQLFLQNGYRIRKLNQAYFAFHGAYADVPGGAAGEDPVGPAVVALREKSPSLAAFLRRIAWITSLDDLQQAVSAPD